MRALLLAAGLGTRLQPLTSFLPKCLVPIHGRPLLDYWLEALLDHGVEEVLINTHHLAPLVQQYLDSSTWLPKVTVVHEERLLGTGGTILRNRAFFQEATCLVAHADNLTIFDLPDFAKQHARRPAGTDLTMMLFETADPKSCGIVEIDGQGVVHAFHEKVATPPGNLANAAVYILEPLVVTRMANLAKEEIDFSTEVIPHFLRQIFTYRNMSYHRDIGTMRSWLEANQDFEIRPAAARNQRAWASIMESSGGQLAANVEHLLLQSN